MSLIEVSAPKVNRSVTFEKDFGASTTEKVEMFGEEVCNSCLDAIFTIKCQAAVRQRLTSANKETGETLYTDEQAIEAGLSFTPQKAERGKKKDPIALMAEQVASGKLSKKDLIKAIEAQIAALEA